MRIQVNIKFVLSQDMETNSDIYLQLYIWAVPPYKKVRDRHCVCVLYLQVQDLGL